MLIDSGLWQLSKCENNSSDEDRLVFGDATATAFVKPNNWTKPNWSEMLQKLVKLDLMPPAADFVKRQQTTSFPVRSCVQKVCKNCTKIHPRWDCESWGWETSWTPPRRLFWNTGPEFWAASPATSKQFTSDYRASCVDQLEIHPKFSCKSSTNIAGKSAKVQLEIHWYPLKTQW